LDFLLENSTETKKFKRNKLTMDKTSILKFIEIL